MNRIHQLDPEQATGKARELFEAARGKFGKVSNGVRVLGNSPAALEGYLALKTALADGVLSAKLQEGLALIVGEINGCGYCLSAHALNSRRTGLSEEEIVAARRASSSDRKFDAALKLARSIAVQRGQIGDGELQAARRAGFNDAELVEIVLHVAMNSMTNFLNNVARTVIDFPEVQPGDFADIPPGAVAVA